MKSFLLKIVSLIGPVLGWVLGTYLILSPLLIFGFFMRHYLIFFVESIAELMVDNSLLGNLLSKDYGYVIHVSAYLGILLLLTFVPLGMTLWFLSEVRFISREKSNKYIIFLVKVYIACYPSLVLAISFDENSFSLITNVISFFVIFSFIFKSNKDT